MHVLKAFLIRHTICPLQHNTGYLGQCSPVGTYYK